MSLSQVQIINMALSKVGDYTISSLTEGTKQQLYGVLHWENVRDSLLQSYAWNFATARVRLAQLAAVPIGYDHQYQLPNDCLKVRKVSIDGSFSGINLIDYKIEGRVLLTDEDTIYIKYTKQVTDTSYWTPLFVKAFSCELASLLAEPLAGMSTGDKQLILNEFEAYITEARGVDFEEDNNEAEEYYSMLTCRDN
jgi:hypothetical protein